VTTGGVAVVDERVLALPGSSSVDPTAGSPREDSGAEVVTAEGSGWVDCAGSAPSPPPKGDCSGIAGRGAVCTTGGVSWNNVTDGKGEKIGRPADPSKAETEKSEAGGVTAITGAGAGAGVRAAAGVAGA